MPIFKPKNVYPDDTNAAPNQEPMPWNLFFFKKTILGLNSLLLYVNSIYRDTNLL